MNKNSLFLNNEFDSGFSFTNWVFNKTDNYNIMAMRFILRMN